MKTNILALAFVALASATTLLAAVEPSGFELRAVSAAPTPTTREHSISHPDGPAETFHLESAVLLDRGALASASAVKDPGGNHGILVKLTPAGAKRFGEIAALHRGQRLGIVVDGKLLAAPVVQDGAFGGSLRISGHWTKSEAAQLAAGLNAGR